MSGARYRPRLLPAAVLALAACADEPARDVPVITLEPRAFVIEVAASGEVRAKQAVSLGSRNRQTVFVAWLAPEGSAVATGDLVVELEANEARTELDRASTEVARIEQELLKHGAQVRARQDDLRAEQTRARIAKDKAAFKAALTDGILPATEIAAAAMDLKLADIDLARVARGQNSQTPRDDAARALLEIRLTKAQNTRDQAKANAEQSRLVAPVAGVVRYQLIWKDNGRGKVAPGDRVWGGSPLVDLIDPKALEFVAQVREADAVHLATGQTAAIELPAFPGRTFTATVAQVAAVAQQSDFDESAKWIDVRLELAEELDTGVFPGLTGTVRIAVLREEGVIAVPRDAVSRDGDKNFVYVAKDGKPEQRMIEIGRESDDSVRVAAGLAAGEVVYARDPTRTEAELAQLRAKRQEEARGRRRDSGGQGGGMIRFF